MLDSATHRLATAIQEYLDEAHGQGHINVSEDIIEKLQEVNSEIISRSDSDLQSPGEKAALEASGGVLDGVQIDRESQDLSPGQRAAREAIS